MTMKPTVVILLSDKRSGSTIFQSELLGHAAVRGLGYTSHTFLESHHWLKAAVMLDRPARLFSAGLRYANYGSNANARTYMIDTILGNVPDYVPPADDRTLVFDGWEALCRHHAQPVFFEKSPQVLAHWAALSLLLEWRAQTDFNVKLVGLVRNPLAVQYSSEKLFGSNPVARQYGWAETHRNMLALRGLLPDDAFMILRHEDIIAAPQASFAKVCDFIGMPYQDGMGDSITDRTQNAWAEDPDYTVQLDPAVRQIAHGLGYDADDLKGRPPKPGQAPGYRRSAPSWQGSVDRYKNMLRDRVVRPARMRRKAAKARTDG